MRQNSENIDKSKSLIIVITDISRIEIAPNKTMLNQIPTIFRVKAYGSFIKESSRTVRRTPDNDDEIETEEESTTFEVNIIT